VFFAKDHKTRDMFDPLARFGPHRRNRLEKSWAKLFREEILPILPVHKLSPRYSGITGSPTKDLYAMLGIMLLQEVHDLTDASTERCLYSSRRSSRPRPTNSSAWRSSQRRRGRSKTSGC